MTTERERMIAGELYRAGDPELVAARKRAQALTRDYNTTTYGDDDIRRPILRELLGSGADRAVIRPPFHVDYGFNIHLEGSAFFNYGCVLLDVCEIRIGDGAEIGPHVQILTADHPRDPETRATGKEFGRPITLGRNIWIGGGAILLPGVTIGDDAVIGAGSVVTRDVAPGTTVAGNPARPLRAPERPPILGAKE